LPLFGAGRTLAVDAAQPGSRAQIQHHLNQDEWREAVASGQTDTPINTVAPELKTHLTTATAVVDRHTVPVHAHYMTNKHLALTREL